MRTAASARSQNPLRLLMAPGRPSAAAPPAPAASFSMRRRLSPRTELSSKATYQQYLDWCNAVAETMARG